ncbi:uncharacterized protein LOC111616069 [Centruroides sculpturatus]|uniref:uncharacterized protein LOC111616069 n=1 Tax=Centruroides sculpturatus TaxID=218467 RepID=UPI000C6CFAC4|nr:uncharacterized protein LOC111616069 [Centruroides sculpturatus]
MSKKSKYRLYQLKKFNKYKQRKQLKIQDSFSSSSSDDDDVDEGCLLQTEDDNLMNENDKQEVENQMKTENQLSPLSDYSSEYENIGSKVISDAENSADYHKTVNSNFQDEESSNTQTNSEYTVLLHENGEIQVEDSSLLDNILDLIDSTENCIQNTENISNMDLPFTDQDESVPNQPLNNSSEFDYVNDINLDEFPAVRTELWNAEKKIFSELGNMDAD